MLFRRYHHHPSLFLVNRRRFWQPSFFFYLLSLVPCFALSSDGDHVPFPFEHPTSIFLNQKIPTKTKIPTYHCGEPQIAWRLFHQPLLRSACVPPCLSLDQISIDEILRPSSVLSISPFCISPFSPFVSLAF
jgi:hypothetical protein